MVYPYNEVFFSNKKNEAMIAAAPWMKISIHKRPHVSWAIDKLPARLPGIYMSTFNVSYSIPKTILMLL